MSKPSATLKKQSTTKSEAKGDGNGNGKVKTKQILSTDPGITQDDLFLIGDSEIDEKGLINHHIESMNEFYESGMSEIITQGFKVDRDIRNERSNTPEDKAIERINVTVHFTKAEVDHPTTMNYYSGKDNEVLFPNAALMSNKTYSANLFIDAHIIATSYMKDNSPPKVREAKVSGFKICRMPIMVRSKKCNTYSCSKQALIELREDHSDEGGYFIVKGVEWSIDCIENILFNKVRIHKNEGFGKEIYRAEFLSIPGDAYQNQGYLLVRWLNDGQITCNIVKARLRNVPIPFFLLLRLLGATTDKEIFDNIIYNYDTTMGSNMFNFMRDAYDVKYTIIPGGKRVYEHVDIMRLIIDELKYKEFKYLDLDNKDENYKQAISKLHEEIDANLLPHIGKTPDVRAKKFRFICLIIRKMFLVRLGILMPTDRDSFVDKRLHPAGPSYAKPFKSYFNAAIVQKISRRYLKDFRNSPFSQVNLVSSFKNSVYGIDFERLLVQSITSGNKTELSIGKKRQITNRLSTQLLEHKNQLNILATLRQVTTTTSDSAKQSERASEMRRVHMTFFGYICLAHSPEGEKVGINKQLSLFSTVSKAASSYHMKEVLYADKLLIHLDDILPEEIEVRELSNVFVNGDWIGCTEDSMNMVRKYRKLRRTGEINNYITIYWENTQDEVYFWTDAGRMLRPMVIVYNNRRDPEWFPASEQKASAKFRQGIAITAKHIDLLNQKKITVHDLMEQQLIEFIAPEEQTNYVLCSTYDRLRQTENDELLEWTHCDIPESQLGITALTCPYGAHNQAVRITYQTNHGKQTCGYYALNWPFRCDKNAFLQYRCEMPLVRTVVNRYMSSNGNNSIVAIACFTGYNQEDSLIASKGSSDRGHYDGCKFTFYDTILDQKEEFGNPDVSTTTNIKSANYEKLEDGFIRIGARIEKGDAIIGKFIRLNKTTSKFLYSDMSIVYRENEPAIVENVIVGRNEDDEKFCKVKIRKSRPISIGDKMSSRHGQKGIVAFFIRDSNNLRTREGLAPSYILNPHALPSRMTIGQLIECLVSQLCAIKGMHIDGTMFRKISVESIGDELEKLGYNRHGNHKVYNGITGEIIDTEIFMGPTFYQRLQKFVAEQIYSVSKSSTDALTYQPLDGKSSGGGLKISELGEWCLVASGISRFQSEKWRDHSDGYVQYICRCGKDAIVNHQKGLYKCNECGDNAMIGEIETTWSAKLLFHELAAMNIGVRRYLTPATFEKYQ